MIKINKNYYRYMNHILVCTEILLKFCILNHRFKPKQEIVILEKIIVWNGHSILTGN